ncbi:MAG: glycerol-3-phosphate dehydrogenase/oxidase [Algiphilus sp.]
MIDHAFPLRRRPESLRSDTPFDVLIIGGGIYGAWAALDAARRGLRTALIDAEDWASGTSSASSKLIHGGLRYLENFEFGLVRHALTERRVLARLAPHMVRPVNFVLPVWRGARVGMTRLRAGLVLYDTLAWGRQPVQRHKRYNRERLLHRYPFLAEPGLRGGFRYGDCQEDDARLTMLVVAAAQAAGAVCVNHVRAESLVEDNGTVVGAELKDQLDGQRWSLRARHTVATVGPWLKELAGEAAPDVQFVKGTHLVVPGIPQCHAAFLLNAPQDGRVFFVIPYYNRTLVGTTEVSVERPADAQPSEEEARYLLAAAHAWMPGLSWSESDVIQRFAGIRTLQAQDANSLSSVTREFEVRQPRPGLTTPIGGKYTTARLDAAEVIDSVAHTLGCKEASSTDHAALPGAPPADNLLGAWIEDAQGQLMAAGLDEESALQAALRHGTRFEGLCERLRDDFTLAQRIDNECPFALVEAAVAIDEEMAMTPDDVLRRRLPLDLVGRDRGAARAAINGLFPR